MLMSDTIIYVVNLKVCKNALIQHEKFLYFIRSDNDVSVVVVARKSSEDCLSH